MLPLPPRPTLFPYTTLFRSKPRTASERYCFGANHPAALSRNCCLGTARTLQLHTTLQTPLRCLKVERRSGTMRVRGGSRSEEHTSELQSRLHLVCRLLLEKK